MSKEFQRKLALVVGGASGIGEQVAKDLAENGASVIIADLDIERAHDVLLNKMTRGSEQTHLAVPVDVSDKSQVEALFSEIDKKYHRPAELILNSAGIAPGLAKMEDVKEEDLDRTLNVNFKGTFFVTQAAGRALISAGKPGSIVNMSSIAGANHLSPFLAHYGASKAAVLAMSRIVAREWGSKGIRVNTVIPGFVDTPMTEYRKDAREGYISRASIPRIGKPKDISEAVLYLLSDRSSFVTGTSLEVSGQIYGCRTVT